MAKDVIVEYRKKRSTKPQKPDTLCKELMCLRDALPSGYCDRCEPKEEPPASQEDVLLGMLRGMMETRRPDPLAVAVVAVSGFNRDTMTYQGRVISVDRAAQLANAVLKGYGIRQLDASPSWLV